MSSEAAQALFKVRRRRWIGLFGAAGSLLLMRAQAGAAQERPSCVVRPEQTEGPYFVDTRLARSDIRADPATGRVEPGVPLQLTFRVARMEAGTCRPLRDAQVELWQCNAQGAYSDVRDRHADTSGQRFLRGYQPTDAAGEARFTTIYPGWYPGRAVHIHFKILGPATQGRREAFASQLYFDDGLSDRVFALPPYAARGPRPVRNGADGIYRRGGAQLMLALSEQAGGLAGTFDIALEAAAR